MTVTNHLKGSVKISSIFLKSSRPTTYGIRSDVFHKAYSSNRGQSKHLLNKPLFMYAKDFRNRIAVRDKNGEYSYGNILDESVKVGQHISGVTEKGKQQRIAFLCSNDVTYITTQWGCWISGHIGKQLYFSKTGNK